MKAHMKTSQQAVNMFKGRNSVRADCNRFAYLRAGDSFEKLNDTLQKKDSA